MQCLDKSTKSAFTHSPTQVVEFAHGLPKYRESARCSAFSGPSVNGCSFGSDLAPGINAYGGPWRKPSPHTWPTDLKQYARSAAATTRCMSATSHGSALPAMVSTHTSICSAFIRMIKALVLHQQQRSVVHMPAARHDWHEVPWRDRYQSERWRKRRRQWLVLHPTCANCESKGLVVVATIVDHVDDSESKSRFDRFLFTNKLQSLCRPCHETKHGRAVGGRRTWIGVDGLPVLNPNPFGLRPSATR